MIALPRAMREQLEVTGVPPRLPLVMPARVHGYDRRSRTLVVSFPFAGDELAAGVSLIPIKRFGVRWYVAPSVDDAVFVILSVAEGILGALAGVEGAQEAIAAIERSKAEKTDDEEAE